MVKQFSFGLKSRKSLTHNHFINISAPPYGYGAPPAPPPGTVYDQMGAVPQQPNYYAPPPTGPVYGAPTAQTTTIITTSAPSVIVPAQLKFGKTPIDLPI